MTKVELLAAARSRLNDDIPTDFADRPEDYPYLWTDTKLTTYLQDAEKEAAERADLLPTEGEATYSTITVVAATAIYALSPLVYEVTRARLSGESAYLTRTSREVLDRDYPLWEDETGTPTHYYVTASNNLRVYPKPTTGGTINLVVLRLPLATMGTSPEINARYHMRLIDWVCRMAYLDRDIDTFDPQRSKAFEDMFEKSFGPRREFKLQTRQLKHMPIIMQDTYSDSD